MDYVDENNIPALLLSADFQKAFDSLKWDFVDCCLQLFNFGPSLSKCAKILYTNIATRVSNNDSKYPTHRRNSNWRGRIFSKPICEWYWRKSEKYCHNFLKICWIFRIKNWLRLEPNNSPGTNKILIWHPCTESNFEWCEGPTHNLGVDICHITEDLTKLNYARSLGKSRLHCKFGIQDIWPYMVNLQFLIRSFCHNLYI